MRLKAVTLMHTNPLREGGRVMRHREADRGSPWAISIRRASAVRNAQLVTALVARVATPRPRAFGRVQ
ncbi:hypothetical protein GCM10010353_42890 [Streptomyces chryseus]|nr:hypothetical protein GCM10010353_42890 [Streptomyces chryseus]